MIPGSLDLAIYQGDTFQLTLRLRTGRTTEYVDLTGYEIRSQIRAKESDPDPLAEFTATLDDQVGNPGGVTLMLTHIQTAALPSSRSGAVWDMQTVSPTGVVWTWLRGVVTITAEVTR